MRFFDIVFAVLISVGETVYYVATKFDEDVMEDVTRDVARDCSYYDETQMSCMVPSLCGLTIFPNKVPATNWTTPDKSVFYMRNADVLDRCDSGATNCYIDPTTDLKAATQIQMVTHVSDLNLKDPKLPVGNCIVNRFIGDYPMKVNASSTGGRYTIPGTAANVGSAMLCQQKCIAVTNCAFWTYMRTSSMISDGPDFGMNCFLQVQEAFDTLHVDYTDAGCGFAPETPAHRAFQNCSGTGVQLCSIFSGYAVTGMRFCDEKSTPTNDWMQHNSFCPTLHKSPSPSPSPAPARLLGNSATKAELVGNRDPWH